MKFHFPIAWNKYTDTKQRIYTKHLMTSKMHSLQPNYKFFVPAQRILWKPKFHTDSKGICQVARGADDRNSKVTSTIGGHAKKKKLTANKKKTEKKMSVKVFAKHDSMKSQFRFNFTNESLCRKIACQTVRRLCWFVSCAVSRFCAFISCFFSNIFACPLEGHRREKIKIRNRPTQQKEFENSKKKKMNKWRHKIPPCILPPHSVISPTFFSSHSAGAF